MKNKAIAALGWSTLAMMLVSLFMVFEWVPTEEDQGIVQLIFYFHVPCAWVAFAAFGIVAIAGGFYLWLEDQIWDDLEYAAAEIGTVFCTLVLITGSLWARPIWGTWWTWDPRLTTSFLLWLLYGGYLMLRGMADDTPEVARFSAVAGIAMAFDVPVVVLCVRLPEFFGQGIHPVVIITRSGEHGLEDPRMVITLLMSLAAFTALFGWLLMLRFQQLRTRSRLMTIRRDVALIEAAAGDYQESY